MSGTVWCVAFRRVSSWNSETVFLCFLGNQREEGGPLFFLVLFAIEIFTRLLGVVQVKMIGKSD